MSRIIEKLESENPYVNLTVGCDEICKACPNNIGGKCKDFDKVERIDNNCLAELDLSGGELIKWQALKQLSYNNIIKENKIKSVCKNCVWQYLCN